MGCRKPKTLAELLGIPCTIPAGGPWGRRGPLGVLPVPRVDPAGSAARVVYVVDLAVEVVRLLPAVRQGQLRPGHLPERGPRSPMQLPAAAGAPGSTAPAGSFRLGRTPRHHDLGSGARGLGALVRAGRGGGAVHAALRPRPGAARSSRRRPSHAAMCVRSGAVRARVRAPPAWQSESSAAAACPPSRRAAPFSLHAAARRPPPPLPPPSRVLSLLSAPPFSERSACDFCLRQVRLGRCR